jgi:hypothetical protein
MLAFAYNIIDAINYMIIPLTKGNAKGNMYSWLPLLFSFLRFHYGFGAEHLA